MPRTDFNHRIDGFAFDNNWTDLSADDLDQMANEIAGIAFAASWTPPFIPVVLTLGGPPVGNIAFAEIIKGVVTAQRPSPTFGLCGGMACAALDYYKLSWVPPRATAHCWTPCAATASPASPG